MKINGKVHCFFEQSGTFKNEFIKLGIPAEDYDIQNNFGETDHEIDLFQAIEDAYADKPSLFDSIRGGQKILDTHLGSGSSRIAAYHAGLDFYGCELDKEYFDKANERFEKEIHGVEVFGNTVITQQSLFE